MKTARSSRTQCLAHAICLLVAAAGTECLAQNSGIDLTDASLEQLGNIKVYTASKHLQSGADAPSSVTVITADEIEKHGYRTLADILRTVRGFFVTNDRNYSSLGVRGFARPGDYNTRILLLVDGHRVNDNVYDEPMFGTEFPVDIDLIARIEIVRGPVSSLYGSNALFAVINIITKRGQDLKGLELSAEAASFNSYKSRITYGAQVGSVEFLVSGTFYGSRGHKHLFFAPFNSPETNNGIATHLDDEQVSSGFGTFSSRGLTLQTVYGTRDKGIPTAPYGTLFNIPGTRTRDSHSYFDLHYERTLGASWDLSARAFYDRYTYAGVFMYESSDPGKISPNLDYTDGKWWGTELQLTKTIFRNRITVGGEYRDNIKQDQVNFSINPFTPILDDRRNSFVGAAYVQDEVAINKFLAVNAGFRYDYYNYLESSTDPRAALIYRPASQTTLKFVYATAFRVPNVYELYYAVTPLLPNPDLRPERIRTTEMAWEQGLPHHLWISTSAFYNWIDDLITDDVVENDLQIFRNLQKVKSSGLEVELRGQFPRGLEGVASYTYQQTKDRTTNQFLSNSPRNLAKLSLSQPLFRKKLFVTLDSQYRARIQSLDGGSVSPFAVVNATVLSRNLGNHVDLSASVYNLLNKSYFDPPSSENLQLPIQQDGRSFRLKITWHPGAR